METLLRDLRAEALSLGFQDVGVCSPDASKHMGAYREWLRDGHHGEMAYLARPDSVERRGDLRSTMDGVRSVVVFSQGYFQPDPPGVPEDRSRGVVARYARGRDYHDFVKGRLQELLAWIDRAAQDRGLAEKVRGFPYVDTGPILEKDLGRRAGLGWFGKNTMLIDPGSGSYFFLGLLLLDLPLPFDGPFQRNHCGTCKACLDACPTGALLGLHPSGAPVMDARRCISYLTIELKGPIPRELRPALGNRVFGCDICQEVCPFNIKFSQPSSEPSYLARGPGEPAAGIDPDSTASSTGHTGKDPGTDSPPLVDLFRMVLDPESWQAFSRGSPIRRTRREGFGRNVAVGLGTWGDPSAVPVLSQGLNDPHPLIRGHAAWALGRIGSADSLRLLCERFSHEEVASVREEIRLALDAPAPLKP